MAVSNDGWSALDTAIGDMGQRVWAPNGIAALVRDRRQLPALVRLADGPARPAMVWVMNGLAAQAARCDPTVTTLGGRTRRCCGPANERHSAHRYPATRVPPCSCGPTGHTRCTLPSGLSGLVIEGHLGETHLDVITEGEQVAAFIEQALGEVSAATQRATPA